MNYTDRPSIIGSSDRIIITIALPIYALYIKFYPAVSEVLLHFSFFKQGLNI